MKQVVEYENGVLEKARGRDIILFDGVCNMCSSSVDFVLDRDPNGNFAFASLQSKEGRELLLHYGLPVDEFDSIVLIRKGIVYQKSRAALEIAARLKGAWPLLRIFKIIPRFIADRAYNFIANNRYRFFGKLEACRFPTPEIRSRFLEGL